MNLKLISLVIVLGATMLFSSCGDGEKTSSDAVTVKARSTASQPKIHDKSHKDKSTKTTGSKEWDEMLDDYDEYVDEYLKFYKKAMSGDNGAMSDYLSMMEKATSLQESMLKAQDNNELSATQIQRMIKIQTKMANVALEM